MTKIKNKHIGSSLDDFLKEEGFYEASTAVAITRILAWELRQSMEKEKVSKTEMAERLNTSRTQLSKLLDPRGTAVTLSTMQKVAGSIGKKIKLELV